MHNRTLMAKFDRESMVAHEDPECGCGEPFKEGETIMLYPFPEYNDSSIREAVCLTCHFWFVHDVLEAL